MRLVTEKCQISIKQETLVYKTYCVSIGIYAGDKNKRKKRNEKQTKHLVILKNAVKNYHTIH